jgi:hypothetical protein
VAIEFADHDQAVQDEAARNLRRVLDQVKRINDISAVYGAPGDVDFTHLDDHVTRARSVVGRWLAKVHKVKPDPLAAIKAFRRMNACIAPAKRGKDSSKDCLIYETYLEAAMALRATGVERPIVFLSSNVHEYMTERRILKPEIAEELDKLSVTFAQSMSEAKFRLGFAST